MTSPSLPPAPGAPESNDKIWIILCHLSLLLGVGLLLPFIVYLVKNQDSALVAAHAKEALNFHISLVIYGICCLPLVYICIGIPLLMGLGVMAFICSIIAAIRASEGGFFYYPLTIRFIS